MLPRHGIAELLPDIVLQFKGELGERRIADVRLYANTNITSGIDAANVTEATLSPATTRTVREMPILRSCASPIIHPVSASRRNTLITMMKSANFCDRYDRAIFHDLALNWALFAERQMWA